MCTKTTVVRTTILCLTALMLLASGCAKKDPGTDAKKLKVVTTLFPLYDFCRNIAGEKGDVSLLLPPGVEVHSFEPRPGDIARISDADVFIYTGDVMEPWVPKLISSIPSKGPKVIDASKGITLVDSGADRDHEADGHDGHVEGAHDHEGEHHAAGGGHHHHGGPDPHIWLDFAYARKMVDTIVEGLVARDPAGKALYERNAAAYKEKLAVLDREYGDTLSTCEKRVIIHGGHFAFGYLARRYGLDYESAYAGSPDAQPSVRRLVELRQKMKKHGVDTVYFEELINPRTAEMMAKETGSKLLKLHGAHNVTKDEMEQGVTFLQLMEQNLVSLRTGLKCTR